MTIVSRQNKTCRTCGFNKPLGEFYAHTIKDKIYYAHNCKPCYRANQNSKRKLISKTGIIYFIFSKEVNRIKIGFTKEDDVEKRLRGIQGQCATFLTVIGTTLGTVADEYALHKKFRKYHSHNEWFNMSDEIREYIQEIKEPTP